ncbi:MAG: GNAT family N-acetyltransferase [Anaerolineales bacterium]|jgi:predicted GNAT family acetyltransferase
MNAMGKSMIEIATAADLARIVEMKLAMFQEGGHADLLASDAREVIQRDYRSLYRRGLARHFVMREGGRIVASAGAFLKSDLPYRYFATPFYGFIGDVYTEPAYRGRGMATQLTREAIAWLAGHGVMEVRLLAFDAARQIYIRMGFRPTDEMVLELRHSPAKE